MPAPKWYLLWHQIIENSKKWGKTHNVVKLDMSSLVEHVYTELLSSQR